MPTPSQLPAYHALALVRPIVDSFGLPWGPTGSVGFELASGAGVVSPDSDLDLIVRTPAFDPTAIICLRDLHARIRELDARIDCLIETPSGAVALSELAGEQDELMLRAASGPRLICRLDIGA